MKLGGLSPGGGASLSRWIFHQATKAIAAPARGGGVDCGGRRESNGTGSGSVFPVVSMLEFDDLFSDLTAELLPLLAAEAHGESVHQRRFTGRANDALAHDQTGVGIHRR